MHFLLQPRGMLVQLPVIHSCGAGEVRVHFVGNVALLAR